MTEDIIIVTEEDTVACDGNGDNSGHPRVFLNLEPKGEVYCPYCSRHFKKANR